MCAQYPSQSLARGSCANMADRKTPGAEWTYLNYMSLQCEKAKQSENSNEIVYWLQRQLIRQGQEILMKARIVRQLGVKRRRQEMALLCGNDPPVGGRSEHPG